MAVYQKFLKKRIEKSKSECKNYKKTIWISEETA